MWQRGRRLRLTRQVLGIRIEGLERVAEHIPPGEIIHVAYGPRLESGRLVDIVWQDKMYSVFTEDLESRSELDEAS
jgi:hypothetical protein